VSTHTDDHPQEEIAKFGLKSERNIISLKNLAIFLYSCWSLLSKDGGFKMTIAHFFHKNLLVWVALNLSLLPSGQNLPKENTKHASFLYGAKTNLETIGKSIDPISP
jgi:hypothetical protein